MRGYASNDLACTPIATGMHAKSLLATVKLYTCQTITDRWLFCIIMYGVCDQEQYHMGLTVPRTCSFAPDIQLAIPVLGQ